MPSRDPRIDAYIANSAPFAQPILTHLRAVVHAACPDVQETIKWGFPHFQYRGMLCAMSAFKSHCALGFWKGSLVVPAAERARDANGLRVFGRITSLAGLPSDRKLASYVKQAMKLNETGVKAPQFANRKPRPAPRTPHYLMAAIRKNKKALATWTVSSPSHKREYVQWVTEAKTEPTRVKRVATTVEWLAQGKARNWKYVKK